MKTLGWLSMVGGGALLGSMLANAPAQLALDVVGRASDVRVSGLLWRGEAAFPAGVEITWSIDPVASLLGLSLAGRFEAAAQGAEAAGRVRVRPGEVTAFKTRIDADWDIVSALAPDISVSCDLRLEVRDARLTWRAKGLDGSASGEVQPGSCTQRDKGGAFATPAMSIEATAVGPVIQASARALEGAELQLADVRFVLDGAASVRLTQAALALAPGAVATGDLELELSRPCPVSPPRGC